MPAPASRPISSSCSRSSRRCGSGSCSPGDQLPTVKEVVGQPRDQPEHGAEGLPRARPRGARRGPARQGTFVSSDAARRSPPDDVEGAARVAAALDRAARAPPGSTRRTWPRSSPTRCGRRPRRGWHERRARARARRARQALRLAAGRCATARSRSRPASVTALVGPNGAGKTTLLQLAVGLTEPSAGDGQRARPLAARARPRRCCRASASSRRSTRSTRGFTIAETLKLGRKLNPSWDDASRCERIDAARPAARPEGRQALGRPAGAGRAHARARQAAELLLLDEPVASLDPLARREFLQSVMEAVAETGMTVVLSSHIVADLERVCDHLVILVDGARRSSPGRSTRSSRATACSPARAPTRRPSPASTT